MEESSAFQEFEAKGNLRRKSLLPTWIKIFLWFFLIGGPFAAIFLIIGPFLTNVSLSLYGINSDHPYTLPGIIVTILLIFKGVVAYGLWFEQKWAPQAAIIDAFTGIAVCIIMMVVIPFTVPNISFTIRLELIPLYFYLKKMQQIKKSWEDI